MVTTATSSKQLQRVLDKLIGVKQSSGGYMALCPAHDDHDPSLSITEMPDGKVLLKCFAGCPTEKVVEKLGLKMADLFPEDRNAPPPGKMVATYDYHDRNGGLLYQAVRHDPKDFRVRRPDGLDWIWNLNGVTRVPYRLPQLVKADPDFPVFVVEGEKDADRLAELGLVATTNVSGAGKWLDAYSEYLRGRKVIIIADNDDPGREHAEKVARSLFGVAASIKLLDLPNLLPKGDVSDWLDAGGTKVELESLAAEAPEWKGKDADNHHHRHIPRGYGCDDDATPHPVDLADVPEPPPLRFVVQDLIPQGFTTNLYAESGQGKSYLAALLARSLVTGTAFIGKPVVPGNVLYLDWELDQDMQRRRWGEVCRGAGAASPPAGLIYCRMTEPLLSCLKEVRRIISEFQPVLIIVDSVGKALGDDPLDPKQVIRFYGALDELGTVMAIDHQPKPNGNSSSDSRWEFGSSYKRNLARSSWQVEGKPIDGGKVHLTLRHKKANFGPLQGNLNAFLVFEGSGVNKSVRLEPAGDGESTATTTPPLQQRILHELKRQNQTAEQLAEATGCEVGSVKNKLTALTRTKAVVVVGREGKASIYGLADNVGGNDGTDHHHHIPNPYSSDDDDETPEGADDEGHQTPLDPAAGKKRPSDLPQAHTTDSSQRDDISGCVKLPQLYHRLAGCCRYLRSSQEVQGVLPALTSAPVVALSLKTTDSDPFEGAIQEIRLAAHNEIYIMDASQVHPSVLRPVLESNGVKVMYDAKTVLRFLDQCGLTVNNPWDVMLADQIIRGGEAPRSCDKLVCEHLGVPRLDGKVGWCEASEDQIANLKVRTLGFLYLKMTRIAESADLKDCLALENRVVPALAWLEDSGVLLDSEGWRELAAKAAANKQHLLERLVELARPSMGDDAQQVNWDSYEQVVRVLGAFGIPPEATKGAELIRFASQFPIVAALLEYRREAPRASTFGAGVLEWVNPTTGRIHPNWQQIGAVSGRMSCSNPCLMNVPRDPVYRACFHAPKGKVLIRADFSQAELRVLAELSGDEVMIQAFAQGKDLHKETAALILSKDVSDVTDDERKAAKVVSLGLIFGMGADGLIEYALKEFGLSLGADEAQNLIKSFFAAYPAVKAWYDKAQEGESNVRTASGRYRPNVTEFTKRLNGPVQGTAADGQKMALALLHQTRDRCPSAKLILAIHDEIVLEVDADEVDAAKVWLEECMKGGMGTYLQKVRIEVDVEFGENWAMGT